MIEPTDLIAARDDIERITKIAWERQCWYIGVIDAYLIWQDVSHDFGYRNWLPLPDDDRVWDAIKPYRWYTWYELESRMTNHGN